jgi:hypothetical protein
MKTGRSLSAISRFFVRTKNMASVTNLTRLARVRMMPPSYNSRIPIEVCTIRIQLGLDLVDSLLEFIRRWHRHLGRDGGVFEMSHGVAVWVPTKDGTVFLDEALPVEELLGVGLCGTNLLGSEFHVLNHARTCSN